ncbi:MAG: gliding motility-associated C-terminal domain-containing protein [Chitinophagales bacterium]|nr:gliding motility-associated C-terminal domain-containing protein [Chitinophagales bacterium]MDW8418049.1 gliding motility-associated C-terminal domain-containing protein [Chitinophagales bacterium]
MSRIIHCVYGLSCLFAIKAHATHYRAGEIIYERIANLTYRCSVITYTTVGSPADKPYVVIKWGDNTEDTINRINGNGEVVGNDIQKNIFVGTHTYSGVPPAPNNFRVISVMDPNRINGINNIDNGNSINVPFYVEDTLFFPNDIPNIGFNSSPILYNMPIDYANVNEIFEHNPNAYDPDGDSLTYRLVVPLRDLDYEVPNYVYPAPYCINCCVSTNQFTINPLNGDVVWNTPCVKGIFNIAILITEYRNGVKMGTLLRDMQIIVDMKPNQRPQIAEFADTCVRAGDMIIRQITATDPNTNQIVKLSANGGPFSATPPATFTSLSGNPATGTFTWLTDCSLIRKQPHQVVFKAEDSYVSSGVPIPLVDLKTWQITIIAPPVQNVTATASPGSITISWANPYVCASSPDFRGFSVWRKAECDSFVPEYCETGLAQRGYTKITTNNIFTYAYTDFTASVGQKYSYRVLAHFSKQSPNGVFQYDAVESVPSNEACVFMPISVPVMLNVDVTATDPVNGQIFVRWSKPLVGGNNLDTTIYPPPYRFQLYRSVGFDFTSPTLIYTSPDAPSYAALADTFYTDSGLNTQDNPYSYQVLFFASGDTVGPSNIASSVYLNVLSSDQALVLKWNEKVPWTNDSFSVFRLNKLTNQYDSIGISFTHQYTDTGLTNDSLYCYYVKAFGHYSVDVFPRPLINKSQIDCGVPVDTTPPCPPVLNVRNDCEQYLQQPWNTTTFINYLLWSVLDSICNDDITRYYIYRSDDLTAPWVLIDSTNAKEDTTYQHTSSDNLAGCYAVTALDRIGNQSALSNVVCVDNCPYYVLPNTFTPNGDGANEKFHPFLPYRFVPKIEIRIYNRWGEEVFKTEDPFIGWNGRVNNTGNECPDGVYLYAGYYYERRLGKLVKKPLGDNKGSGYIHLIRGM